MILHQFPDLKWLKEQAEQNFANRKAWGGAILPQEGWPTVILNTQTKNTYRDNIRGPLSIFLNIVGESTVRVGGKSSRIKEDLFFISNQNQKYTLEIDEAKPVETFNIHFGEQFASQVLESLQEQTENLLDHSVSAKFQSQEFHNRLQPISQPMKCIIATLKNNSTDNLLQEEKLSELIEFIFLQEKTIEKARRQIPSLKTSTRQELLQRLLYSTDYIYSYYDIQLSLDELAQVSCLSKFHFLRLFKIAFQKTPHQFITEVRLQKAKELLKRTKLDVREISKSIGFENSSSFSRLFYNTHGVYPTQYR